MGTDNPGLNIPDISENPASHLPGAEAGNEKSEGCLINMTGDDFASQWEQVVIQLRGQLGESTYQNWLRFVSCDGLEGGSVLLSAPTRFKRDWVNTHLGDALLAAWQRVNSQALRVDLRTRSVASEGTDGEMAAQAVQSPVRVVNGQDHSPNQTADANGANPFADQYGRIGAPLDPRFTFENFVVGKSNEFAHAAARRVADSETPPFNPLFLHGGVGLGKTHLMHAIAHAIRAHHPGRTVLYLSAEKFMYQFIKALREKDTMPFKETLRSVDVLMVDDLQFIGGKGSTQEEFFHTFNALIDHQKQLVISADRSPSDLDGIEERVRSRLGWGLVADIHPTDYELRLGILLAKAEAVRRQAPEMEIAGEVLEFLAHRISSNVRDVEGALTRVVAYAQMVKRPVSVDMAREVLQDLLRASERRITIDEIQRKSAEFFNVRLSDMLSARRARAVARPRQVAMYLAKQLTARSLPEIGRKFGGRDHTTVIHAVRRIEQLRESDNALNEDVEKLQRLLQG